MSDTFPEITENKKNLKKIAEAEKINKGGKAEGGFGGETRGD